MYYFGVKFKDGRRIYQENLSKRQAVIRYNMYLKEMAVLEVQLVEWGLL